MSTAEQVKQIVAEQLGREVNELDLDASFVRDLGADSLDLSECMVAFEQTFKIRISSEQAQQMSSLRHAIAYIEAHAPASASAASNAR
jgi:acyl carrier protein